MSYASKSVVWMILHRKYNISCWERKNKQNETSVCIVVYQWLASWLYKILSVIDIIWALCLTKLNLRWNTAASFSQEASFLSLKLCIFFIYFSECQKKKKILCNIIWDIYSLKELRWSSPWICIGLAKAAFQTPCKVLKNRNASLETKTAELLYNINAPF